MHSKKCKIKLAMKALAFLQSNLWVGIASTEMEFKIQQSF